MPLDCSVAVEDRFGPIVNGCRSNFDFTLLFEETILFIGPLCLAWALAGCRVLQLWPRRASIRSGPLLPSKFVSAMLNFPRRLGPLTGLMDLN
jgi:hypothetical protein